MTDLSDLIPLIASHFGLDGATLVFYLVILNRLALVISRRIPDSQTGWLGTVRDIAGIIGTDVSNRIKPGVSVVDVATAAAATPPIDRKVEEDAK